MFGTKGSFNSKNRIARLYWNGSYMNVVHCASLMHHSSEGIGVMR